MIASWALITLGKLLDHLQKLEETTIGTPFAGELKPLIDDLLKKSKNEKQKIDLENLRKKTGKAPLFTGVERNGAVIKGSLQLISSDTRDKMTEDLMRENEGLAYFK